MQTIFCRSCLYKRPSIDLLPEINISLFVSLKMYFWLTKLYVPHPKGVFLVGVCPVAKDVYPVVEAVCSVLY